MNKINEAILACSRDRHNNRRTVSAALGGHLSLRDAEAVNALPNDGNRLLQLLVGNAGPFRHRLWQQDHLGATLEVKAEPNSRVGARPKGPRDKAQHDDCDCNERAQGFGCCGRRH